MNQRSGKCRFSSESVKRINRQSGNALNPDLGGLLILIGFIIYMIEMSKYPKR